MPILPDLAFPILRRLDPERAHRLAIAAIGAGLAGAARAPDPPVLATTALGLHFANPIGLAAGFDKDAAALGGLARLGFGFLEAGTVTLRPQPGNPKPRLFRLPRDGALINRMGFNNGGIDGFARRFAALSERPRRVPVGANLGINKEGADPGRDYRALFDRVATHADYVVINVSSPNTPGLRALQDRAALAAIIESLGLARPGLPPCLLKLAPDLGEAAIEELVGLAIETGVAGLILTNTTTARPDTLVERSVAGEAGGLSGRPLFARSTALLRHAADLARGRLVLIGAGGVASGREALAKLKAGASLVQLYTAFVLEGPSLVGRVKSELAASLRQEGYRSVAEAVGADLR